MARQIVVLALIFFAVVGMASAAANAPASSDVEELAPNNDVIGTLDGVAAEAGPVGSPVSPEVFPSLTPAGSPSSAAALEVSTIAGVITTAFVGSFFF